MSKKLYHDINEGQIDLFAVDIHFFRIAVLRAFFHAHREDVLFELTRSEYLADLSRRFILDGDTVGDLESRLLSHRLDLGNDLSFDTLFDQFVGELGIQRDRNAAIAR